MVADIILDWIEEGIELNIPASREAISTCETLIDFKFPNDFIEFYSLHNGFAEFVMDSKFLSLWPLQKIQSEFNPTDEFVAFCDFLVNSHQIGYIEGQHGIYKDYNRTLICRNFSEFLFHWKIETFEYM